MKRTFAGLVTFFFLSTGLLQADAPLLAKLEAWRIEPTMPEYARLASLLEQSMRSYEALSDYRAIFTKREKVENSLGPEEKIFLKFEKPFKIYMGWLNEPKQGLQVVYERGKHDGKLAIHKPGLILGLAQVIFLEQNSPWVREGSANYNIEDAGIGTFLYDFSGDVLKAAHEKHLKVSFSPSSDTGKQGVEVVFEQSTESSGYLAYRVIVDFDSRTQLPVRMELYDWQNQPTGVYSYDDIKPTVGSDDPEFKKQINRYLYRVYDSSGRSSRK